MFRLVEGSNALASTSVSSASAKQGESGQGLSFSQMLQSALDGVNQSLQQADVMAARLAVGEVTDIHQVMIAAEKANIALQLTISIRNQVIEAYQEIGRMQI